MKVEVVLASRNLLTSHRPEDYPAGIEVVRPGPQWKEGVLVAPEGATFEALGGERAEPWQTASGHEVAGFGLNAGDRATLVTRRGPSSLGEWRIERVSA